ncbi:T9SS type A sorting domain-containing protein [bacterium]|nr:T9SS type A sorting domain-containing protein [bacterium]
MKMRIVLVLMFILAFTAHVRAYEKTVMVEFFSNYFSLSCATQEPVILDWLNSTSREDAVFITYHLGWPGAQDWYYVSNPDPAARWNYYVQGTQGLPYFIVDGLDTSNTFSSLFTVINNRIGSYTPVDISIQDATIHFDGTISAQVTVSSEVALSGHRLHTVLNDIDCPYGEAPSGYQNYRYNVLDMAPDTLGTDLGGIPAGGSETFDFTFDLLPDHAEQNHGITFLVQNEASREVLQAKAVENLTIAYPNLSVAGYELDDSDQVLPNGRPDPGESVDLILTVQNQETYQATDNLTGSISCDNDQITFSQDAVTWPGIAPGESASNAADPFVIDVPMGLPAEYVTFSVHFEDGSGYELDWDFPQLVGSPDLALVDDSPANLDLESDLLDLILESGLTMEMLSSAQALTADLSEYDAVVWMTSNATVDVLTTVEISALSGYLDAGGKVLLSGENIGEFAGTEDLLATWFMAEHELDDIGEPDALLNGVPAGPFPDAVLVLGDAGAGTSEAPASITPLPNATGLFEYDVDGTIGGVCYTGDSFATVYLAFNLEAVSGSNDSWRGADVLWNCMHWMGATTSVADAPVEEAALPRTVELSGYPNPFNAAMTVRYSLPAAAKVNLSVINLLGRTVAELSGGLVRAGVHEVMWDASALSSGVYFLSLNVGDERLLEKVVLLK